MDKKNSNEKGSTFKSRLIDPPNTEIFMPVAISIGNRKGGVGKTTLTTNLANELSKAGYKVVMLDLDSQTDLTDMNLKQDTEYNIHDILKGRSLLNGTIYKVNNGEGQDIIPGSSNLDEIGTKIKQSLELIIDELKEIYDIVLFDHPPGLNKISIEKGVTFIGQYRE